jgi:hypothetical protein
MHDWGNAIRGRGIDSSALQGAFTLLAALFTFASSDGVLATGAFALQEAN